MYRLGYISLVIGLSFFFRGFMMWRRAQAANDPSPLPSDSSNNNNSLLREKTVVQSESSHLMHLGLLGPTTTIMVSGTPSPVILPSGSSATLSSSNNNNNTTTVVINSGGESPDKATALMLAEVMEVAKAKRRKRLRMFSAVVGSLIAGIASGLIGFGGGMIFVLVFFIVLQKEQLLSTGTGCFVMCALTAWLALIYETGGTWLDFSEHIHISCIWEELVLLLLGGALGSFLGSFFVMGVSPVKLNLLVGTVLFVTGLVATIQSQVFPGDENGASTSASSTSASYSYSSSSTEDSNSYAWNEY
jgi:hypothetical protein